MGAASAENQILETRRGDVSFRIFFGAVVAILAAAVGLQLFFLHRGFYSIGWDEAGRTLDAYRWAHHGIVTEPAWLPFYRVCVGMVLRASPDLILTPRHITLVFGLVAILASGWLAWELFQDRRIALLTLALAAFFPQRIALALAPLSDIMFIPMILAAGALLARALRNGSTSALLGCGLVGALATTVRYEGWLFAAHVFLAAAMWGVPRKALLILGAILFLFPAAWSLTTFGTTFPVTTVVQDGQKFSLLQVVRKNPAAEFVYMNLRSLNLLGFLPILGIVWRGDRRLRAMIIVFFTPLFIASAILLLKHTAQTGPSWRMIAVWSLLLLPFTAYFVATARPSLRLLVVPLLLMAFIFDTFTIARQSFWAFPASSRQAGEYLGNLIASNPESKVLIDSTTFAYLNLQLSSQVPDAFVLGKAVPASPPKDVRFLAFQDDGQKKALELTAKARKLTVFGPWFIYEVVPER